MPTSSQGHTAVPNARKVSYKLSRSGGGSDSQLDSSTLALAHGSTRTYEAGLPDNGSGGDGITLTVSAEGLGTKPALGTTVSYGGKTAYCTESSTESNVGELQAWSATYSSEAAPSSSGGST